MKKLILIILTLSLLLSLCGCGKKESTAPNSTLLVQASPEPVVQGEKAAEMSATPAPTPTPRREVRHGIETLLFMGLDETGTMESTESFRNKTFADFLLLIVIDNDNQSYKGIHINRDTMVDVPVLGLGGVYAGTEFLQITYAHTWGDGMKDSCRNTAEAVSNLLGGITVDNYASLAMSAIGIVNDIVGGVTVTINEDYSQVDPDMEMGKTITLNAKQADEYIHQRYYIGDGSNAARMLRQRDYMEKWIEKASVLFAEDKGIVDTSLLKLNDYLVTNLTAHQMSRLAEKLSEYKNGGITYIEGEDVQGEVYIEFYPDEEKLAELIEETFY